MEDDAIQWYLPSCRNVTQLKLTDPEKEHEEIYRDDASREFWDAKFYPYTKPGVDPIFVVINARHILICRPKKVSNGKAYEVIQAITDLAEDTKMYCCVWSKDPVSGSPLLIVGGENASIRIYDVLTGSLSRVLIGPGGKINDMDISPTDPNILATGSADDRVTIWNLHPDNAQQPCMFILAGAGGHRESLLSVSFHANGRYLVSGGEDKMVKMWRLPESYPPSLKTQVIPYPVFSTSAVHSGHVECVKFLGDLILSKAHQENCIVLWKIEGFSSSVPPPLNKAQYLESVLSTTFSDFSPDLIHDPSGSTPWAAYTRIAQFATPNSNCLYMRFGLYRPSPTSKFTHPILSYCNSASQVMFWDFSRLDSYAEYINAALPQATKVEPFDGASNHNANKMELDNDTFENPVPNVPKPSWLQIAKPRKTRKAKAKNASIFPNFPAHSNSASPFGRSTSPTLSVQTVSTARNLNSNSSESPFKSTEPMSFDTQAIFTTEDLVRSKRTWDEMYSTAYKDRWKKLKAHKVVAMPTYNFTGRQVAWDSNGEWCVACGSENVVAVCGR